MLSMTVEDWLVNYDYYQTIGFHCFFIQLLAVNRGRFKVHAAKGYPESERQGWDSNGQERTRWN
jgi:hypothetical protein